MMAALALSAGAAPMVLASQPAMTSAPPGLVTFSKRSVVGSMRTSLGLYGHKGVGITAAQQKRASAKKRGVARNRRHHR